MKYLMIVGWLMAFCLSALAQEKEVVLRKGLPVFSYALAPNETSYQLYKKFGMDEAQFLSLNTDEAATDSNENLVWISVNAVLLGQCQDSCTTLVYNPAPGDDFKSIGKYFGNLNPYLIKKMNPNLEAVVPGKMVKVGFLPAQLLAAPTAIAAVPAKMPDSAAGLMKPVKLDTAVVKTTDDLYSGLGYYAGEFKETSQEKKIGKAANFKSFGGWYDGKFYVLINDLEMGTVVKITNQQNGLSIFAKVVSVLPDLKSEKVLLARINNAACAALDIWGDEAFDVEIQF